MNEPSIEKLIEARERADAGLRLVFPQLFDGATAPAISAPPPLDAETAARVGSWLLDARAAVLTAAALVPLEGEELLHSLFNLLVNQFDDIAGALGERFES